MKVIDSKQFKKRTSKYSETAILSLRPNGLFISQAAVEQAKIPVISGQFFATFASDAEGQLHVKFSYDPIEGSCLFKTTSNKNEYIYHNKGLSEHLKALTKCDKSSVPCKIQIQAVTEDGWYPVITTYWKSLE